MSDLVFGSVTPEKRRQSEALSAMAEAFLNGRPAPEGAADAFPSKPVGVVAQFFADNPEHAPKSPPAAPVRANVGQKHEQPRETISELPDRLSVSEAELIEALRALRSDANSMLERLERLFCPCDDVQKPVKSPVAIGQF